MPPTPSPGRGARGRQKKPWTPARAGSSTGLRAPLKPAAASTAKQAREQQAGSNHGRLVRVIDVVRIPGAACAGKPRWRLYNAPMRWSIIRLIWLRELRDQLRDRRTLFMIAVLPLLLYPLVTLAAVQFTFGFADRPSTVGIVGRE